MGQYHTLVCPRAGMTIRGSEICGGVKALEHIWSPGTPAALAYLTVAGTANHPRDLPWAPKGLWAGLEPLMIGDYAEAGDLQGRDEIFPGTEPELYALAGDKRGSLTDRPRKAKTTRELADAFLPVMERVFGSRFTNIDANGMTVKGWREAVDVAPSDAHPSGWDFDYANLSDKEREELLEFYKRMGVLSTDVWRRPPLPLHLCGSYTIEGPETVPGVEEAGEGDALLWVNIDRGEFIDPRTLGDTPDLVGVMKGSSAKAALATLFHHDRRGGGDLADDGPLNIAGRWRGDRIVLMGSNGFKPKTGRRIDPDQARAEFTDISGLALAFVAPEQVLGAEYLDHVGRFIDVSAPGAIEADILREIVSAPEMQRRREEDGLGALAGISVRLTPPCRIDRRPDGKPLTAPIEIAGSAEVFAQSDEHGKIWLPHDTQRRIAALVAQLPATSLKLAPGDREDHLKLDVSCVRIIDMSALSNHHLLDTLAA